MSFAGQVLWKRSVMGVCAREIIGNASPAAPAAPAPPARSLRRMGCADAVAASALPFFMEFLLWVVCFETPKLRSLRMARLSGRILDPAPRQGNSSRANGPREGENSIRPIAYKAA